MEKKKILMLGGSAAQLVAIKKARELGYYTVLCDYLPDNPGQHLVDKFYLVSTIDKEAVLKVARQEAVDGIVGYASDPAATTVAYVAEKMGLPGNPYKAVEILQNKDKFRAFLQSHGFCTPKAKGYDSIEEALQDLEQFPVIVKPVDGSGSKGVSRIDAIEEARDKLESAMSYSRCKRIIVEDWVEKYGYQIAGDGLSVDGKLIFRYFGNDHFNPQCVNPFVPISASFPYNMPEEVHNKIHATIQRLLNELGMKTSTYNFDMRIDEEYNVYLMEVTPRDGGNYIPDVTRYATGVDLVECAVKAAMGEKITIPEKVEGKGFWSYYAVHSLKDGILDEIKISEEGQKHIIENHIIKKPGDKIEAFRGAGSTLGCLVMQFDTKEQMLHMMDHSEEWIQVKLK